MTFCYHCGISHDGFEGTDCIFCEAKATRRRIFDSLDRWETTTQYARQVISEGLTDLNNQIKQIGEATCRTKTF